MQNNLTIVGAKLIRALALALVVMVLWAITGCSGGGGGPVAPAPVVCTILGGLQDSSGTPLSGYTIIFDKSSQLLVLSNAQGQFSLSVPASAVTGTDTLVIKDTTGAIIKIEPVIVPTTVSSTISIGTLTLNNPPPPPGLSN